MEANKNKIGFGNKLIKTVTRNPIVFLLLIAAIVVGCLVENFFSWANLSNLMSNTAIRFLIALGVSGCLITKGTDPHRHRHTAFDTEVCSWSPVVAIIWLQRT